MNYGKRACHNSQSVWEAVMKYWQSALGRFVVMLQKQVFIAVVLLTAAIAFRYYVLNPDNAVSSSAVASTSGEIERSKSKSNSKAEPQETAIKHAKKHLNPTYVCPMHASVTSTDANAECPICGMKLVPMNMDGDSTESSVTVAPGILNMLGVRTEQARRGTLFRYIDSVGYIAYDDNLIKTISLRTEGWIDQLAVKAVGTRVKKGDLLLAVYSPKLVNAQSEFLAALNSRNEDMIAASFGRLNSLGISLDQVRVLERTRKVERRVKIFAPQDGVVSELTVREGAYVEPAAPIINLVDLSKVWLIVNVFERHADWVRVGNKAQATLASLPDKQWEGVVDYIYPNIDPKTRSLLVRVHLNNPDEVLKPNMYAEVKLFTSPKPEAISVPREALIRTGDSNRIILSLGTGKFKPVPVRVGIETGDRIEILEGLDEGAEVVVSSQFLLDSESSLRATLMRMNGN